MKSQTEMSSTIEELRPNLFRLPIPLPKTSLGYLNSYVIRDGERTIIIDTGLNETICREAMQKGLNRLGVTLSQTDLFITHLHHDHFGLAQAMANDVNRIYFSRFEYEAIQVWQGWAPLSAFAQGHGFPASAIRITMERLPYNNSRAHTIPDLTLMEDGDLLQIGPYRFIGMLTAGHSFGHMCLYEPDHKLLFSGDHVLNEITPSLQCWSEERNPLGNYLDSLNRISRLDVDLVFPGHKALITDHRTRIAEIKSHHEVRCQEIITLLTPGSLNGYEVASRMSWDIDLNSWDEFPPIQKWFAFGEAMAHLKYLDTQGYIKRFRAAGQTRFALNGERPKGMVSA